MVRELGTVPTIYRLSDDETVAFASTELRDYLSEMLGVDVTIEERNGYDADDGIWVGTGSAIPEANPSSVTDPALDDSIHVDVGESSGFIAGITPRSTLIATYRYLRELGCRWVRPGPDGERIPSIEHLEPVSLREEPSYRHRGITIEGAVSDAHVLDIIDWAPKAGYNAYFLQFFEAYPFFERWYTHEKNPTLEGEEFSEERARELHAACIEAMEKRDLAHHAVGHGWTARALDLPDRGWDEDDSEIAEELTQYLAEIDGERALYDGIPVNTELCYSNPEARELLVDEIVEYAADHPGVDVLHFWASDGHNNHCECESCQGTRPSDLYVRMLNELDERLTDRGVDTRIAFLIYTDLLWPPERETIESPDRFSLMFAPITRSYAEEYGELDDLPEVPPYERNELEFPSNLAENVSFLRAWQSVFDGDSFVFDYHLMWNHLSDAGFMRAGEVLAADMRDLVEIDLDGNVSCQLQRVFAPTGLPMVAMGEILWDRDRSFEGIATDHFAAEFGEDADAAREYLETLSEHFDPLYSSEESILNDVEMEPDPDTAASFEAVPEVVDEFRPTIERNCEERTGTVQQSWEYLDVHADIYRYLARALAARARGNDEQATELWTETRTLAQEREMDIYPVFDLYFFVRIFDHKFDVE